MLESSGLESYLGEVVVFAPRWPLTKPGDLKGGRQSPLQLRFTPQDILPGDELQDDERQAGS